MAVFSNSAEYSKELLQSDPDNTYNPRDNIPIAETVTLKPYEIDELAGTDSTQVNSPFREIPIQDELQNQDNPQDQESTNESPGTSILHSPQHSVRSRAHDLIFSPLNLTPTDKLLKAYILSEGVGNNHVEGFDQWVTSSLHRTIMGRTLTLKAQALAANSKPTVVTFGHIRIHLPHYHKSRESLDLTPQYAREQSVTYGNEVYINIQEHEDTFNGKVINEVRDICIATIPTMLKSRYCLLRNKTPDQLATMGEDPNDPGGYFIILGQEKVIHLQEQLATNRIYIMRMNPKKPPVVRMTVIVPKSTALCELGLKKSTDIIRYRFPSLMKSGDEKFEAMNALRVFRLFSFLYPDADWIPVSPDDLNLWISGFISTEHQTNSLLKLTDTMLDYVSYTDDVNYILQRRPKAANITDISEQRAVVKFVFDVDLFPHLNDLAPDPGSSQLDLELKIAKAKMQLLAIMITYHIEYMAGYRQLDDRDSWSNKKVEGAGRMNEILFRDAWRKLLGNIQDSINTGKTKTLNGIADKLRTDFITKAYVTSYNMGSWGVRGTGTPTKENVVQMRERGNIAEDYSSASKVNVPIPRTDRQVGIRMVQPSQLGFIDPASTPEGINAGILKDLSCTSKNSLERSDAPIISFLYDVNNLQVLTSQVVKCPIQKRFWKGDPVPGSVEIERFEEDIIEIDPNSVEDGDVILSTDQQGQEIRSTPVKINGDNVEVDPNFIHLFNNESIRVIRKFDSLGIFQQLTTAYTIDSQDDLDDIQRWLRSYDPNRTDKFYEIDTNLHVITLTDKIMVNGKFLGWALKSGTQAKNFLIGLRRKQLLPYDMSVVQIKDWLYVDISPSRLIRPLIIVNEDQTIPKIVSDGVKPLHQLFADGLIEFISAWEQEYIKLAIKPSDLKDRLDNIQNSRVELAQTELEFNQVSPVNDLYDFISMSEQLPRLEDTRIKDELLEIKIENFKNRLSELISIYGESGPTNIDDSNYVNAWNASIQNQPQANPPDPKQPPPDPNTLIPSPTNPKYLSWFKDQYEAIKAKLQQKKAAYNTARISQPYTHCELDPQAMLGDVALTIPWPDHNQAPRNTYAISMARQALMNFSIQAHLLLVRAKMLTFSNRPLVETFIYNVMGMDKRGPGENIVLAFMNQPFNQEDGYVVKKGFLENGGARFAKYFIYKTKADLSGAVTEKFTKPEEREGERKGRYQFLSTDRDTAGLPLIGSYLKQGDCVIGKVRFDPTTNQFTNDSLFMKPGDMGIVDQVIVTSDSKIKKVTVKIRHVRQPQCGDKYAPRCAQKATIGQIIPDADMPVSEDGISPDFIINSSVINSRMTVALLMELLAAKHAAFLGTHVNGGAFHDFEWKKYRQTLRRYDELKLDDVEGYINTSETEKDRDRNPIHYGYEFVKSGCTGYDMEVPINMGPVFMQSLKHHVLDKIQCRSTGNVRPATRQPPHGRIAGGGVRFGEMEKDNGVAHGAAAFVQERLMRASDKYQTIVCRQCGSFAYHNTLAKKGASGTDDTLAKKGGSGTDVNIQNPDSNRPKFIPKAEPSPSEGEYICPICGGTSFGRVTIPYAFKLFKDLLASCGIKLNLIVETPQGHLSDVLRKGQEKFAQDRARREKDDIDNEGGGEDDEVGIEDVDVDEDENGFEDLEIIG